MTNVILILRLEISREIIQVGRFHLLQRGGHRSGHRSRHRSGHRCGHHSGHRRGHRSSRQPFLVCELSVKSFLGDGGICVLGRRTRWRGLLYGQIRHLTVVPAQQPMHCTALQFSLALLLSATAHVHFSPLYRYQISY